MFGRDGHGWFIKRLTSSQYRVATPFFQHCSPCGYDNHLVLKYMAMNRKTWILILFWHTTVEIFWTYFRFNSTLFVQQENHIFVNGNQSGRITNLFHNWVTFLYRFTEKIAGSAVLSIPLSIRSNCFQFQLHAAMTAHTITILAGFLPPV